MAKTNRNGAIDVLRFVFCVIIVLRHSFHAVPEGGKVLMPGGAIGVEFFFIVSGYLMACSAYKRFYSDNKLSISTETHTFMKRKASSLLPDLVVASIISMTVVTLTYLPQGKYAMLIEVSKRIWNPLLLSASGLGSTNELWYLSAMILVMLAYYPLLMKRFEGFVRIVAPLIAIFSLGYIDRKFDSILDPAYFIDPIYKGMVRAIGEIALGVALFPLIRFIAKQDLTKVAKTVITLVNVFCLLFAINLMYSRKDKKLDLFIVLLLTVVCVLTFSHQGIAAKLFDNKFSTFLGKLSLTLYLSHRWVAITINNIYNYLAEKQLYGFGKSFDYDYNTLMKYYFLGSIISCAVIYIICALLRKYSIPLKNLWKKAVLRKPAE